MLTLYRTSTLPWMLFALLGSTAQAASFSKQLPLGSGGRVNISNVAGSVIITTWERREVDVQGELGEDVQRVDMLPVGSGVDIKVVLKRSDRREGHAQLRIRVPADAQVEAATVSATLTATGLQGRTRLRTISADLRCEMPGGDVEATSVSGRIQIVGGNARARIRVSAVSGAVQVERGMGDLDVHATSGRIDLDLADADHVDASAVSGGIRVRGTISSRGNLELDSVSGRISVALASPNYRFEASSYSGRVSSCFGGEAVRSSSRGSRLEGSRGNGGGLVDASSHSGSVEICDR